MVFSPYQNLITIKTRALHCLGNKVQAASGSLPLPVWEYLRATTHIIDILRCQLPGILPYMCEKNGQITDVHPE